jgi:hypothetical protein
MSTHPGWKRTTQVKLIAELQGFWAEDLWLSVAAGWEETSSH